MWPFRRAEKPDPEIVVGGLVARFDASENIWKLPYKGFTFQSDGPRFVLPAKADLDEILASIEAMSAEMQSRIDAYWAELAEPERSPGEVYDSVWITDWAEKRIFEVTWFAKEDDGWGDLSVQFQILDGKIIEEQWGD